MVEFYFLKHTHLRSTFGYPDLMSVKKKKEEAYCKGVLPFAFLMYLYCMVFLFYVAADAQ